MIIKGKDWRGHQRVLKYDSGEPVRKGDEITDFRGDPCIIVGGRAPHKQSSTGFVDVKIEDSIREYYPTVFNLRWT